MLPMALREGAASADPQWARLQVDMNCRVRRGAWYRVADLTPAEVRLDVNREQIPLPRTSLKIVSAPPQHWTIVARPRDARSLPAHWGDKYAVCPGCRNRMELKGAPHRLRCARCECVFHVGWVERRQRRSSHLILRYRRRRAPRRPRDTEDWDDPVAIAQTSGVARGPRGRLLPGRQGGARGGVRPPQRHRRVAPLRSHTRGLPAPRL